MAPSNCDRADPSALPGRQPLWGRALGDWVNLASLTSRQGEVSAQRPSRALARARMPLGSGAASCWHRLGSCALDVTEPRVGFSRFWRGTI